MLILPNKSIAIWKAFWEENKILIYKYIVKQVKSAIDNNEDKAVLFGFEGNKLKVWIEQEKYVDSLEKALNLFVKEEYFEHAAKTQKIINEFLIDTVIKESNSIKE